MDDPLLVQQLASILGGSRPREEVARLLDLAREQLPSEPAPEADVLISAALDLAGAETADPEPVIVLPAPVNLNLMMLEEMFPDADPKHLSEKLAEFNSNVEDVIDELMKTNGKYPKRHKRKRSPSPQPGDGPEKPEEEPKKTKINRLLNMNYVINCEHQLQLDFPHVTRHKILRVMRSSRGCYFESSQNLSTDVAEGRVVFKKTAYKKKIIPPPSAEFNADRERWLQLKRDACETAKPEASSSNVAVTGSEEMEMECGCCYTDHPMSKMTQCEDAHLFCLECARRHAETLIGMRKTEIKCIDSSGCVFPFPRVEMVRFLNPAVLEGYDRLVQEENLRVAGMSDLVACPFCDFKICMDTDPAVDKLFHCLAAECGVVSCRLCRRKNHVPMSCEEAAKEDSLGAKHQIEEAMTEALLRECYGCKAKFFKEEGCNKMTCPQCQKMMCYVCKVPVKGYDHFANDPNGRVQKGNTCPLWDDTAARNNDDVVKAAKEAAEKLKDQDPNVDVDAIKVDLPPAPPPRPPPVPQPPQPVHHRGRVVQPPPPPQIIRPPPIPVPQVAARPIAAPRGGRGRRRAAPILPPPPPAPVIAAAVPPNVPVVNNALWAEAERNMHAQRQKRQPAPPPQQPIRPPIPPVPDFNAVWAQAERNMHAQRQQQQQLAAQQQAAAFAAQRQIAGAAAVAARINIPPPSPLRSQVPKVGVVRGGGVVIAVDDDGPRRKRRK